MTERIGTGSKTPTLFDATSIAPNVVQAAFDAVGGNDGVEWELLENNCSDGMKLGDFIDTLVGCGLPF